MNRPEGVRGSDDVRVLESGVLPDDPGLADAAADLRSAYVHVPFCHRVCPYCDFAVVEGRMDTVGRYVDAVCVEIDDQLPWGPLDAVFVGGGTPSAVPSAELGRILRVLEAKFGLAGHAEVTLEANPEDWTDELASGLRDAGFTRVSFGAQSYEPAVLSSLGRGHNADQIDVAVGAARSAGFDSVSLDLIFGTPGETVASWRSTVQRSVEAGVDHVSTYSLTVEPGTALWRQVRSGADGPDPDDQAEKWEIARAMLTDAGFIRYEVSNYARPGHHCRYNLAVWDQGEYLAVGLGAHGFRSGVRTANVRRLDTYIDRVERGIGPTQSTDVIEGWSAELERLMLGLRRAAGVVAGQGGAALLASTNGARLSAAGVIDVVDDRLVIARPLLTDEVVRAVLSLPQREGRKPEA